MVSIIMDKIDEIGMYGHITNMKVIGVLFILCIMELIQQKKKQKHILGKR